MKRALCILLIIAFVFSLAACGAPEINENLKTRYAYPKKYDIHEKYSMENVVKDTNELYDAICEAYPGKPVLAVIRQSYSGDIYPLELNDALNTWLSDNGYGFSLMVYSFGNYGLKNGKTFEMQVEEYIEAGGRCDIIATGANIVNLAGIPGDTVWDYVEDGLIVPVGSLATEDQLKAVADIYGDDYLKINSDNGEIYGFSATTFEVSNMGKYLATYVGTGLPGNDAQSLRDLAFLNIIPRETFSSEMSWSLLNERSEGSGRKYLANQGNKSLFPNTLTLSQTTSVEGIINAVLTDESYTRVNMLPLYIHETESGAEVVALWEIPLFEEIMQGYVEIVEEDILSLNAPRNNGVFYYFESYSESQFAQEQMMKETEIFGENVEIPSSLNLSPMPHRIIVSLGNESSVTGPECSLFVASGSENKDLALEFVLSALTDEALGEVLCIGIEGVSYTVENGVRKDIMNNIDTIIYPNPMYRIPTEYELEDSREIAKTMQENAEFDLYENFNADLSDCREEAEALALWNRRYQNALWLFDEEATEAYGYNMKSFLENPAYPEIEALRASVERQLAEYESIYR